MNYYVMADNHGFFAETVVALQSSGYYEDSGEKKIIICGDLFDRGKQANEMQEFVADLIKNDGVILIRGNHEELMLNLVENLEEYATINMFFTHHFRNGTMATLCALTDFDLVDLATRPEVVRKKFYNTTFYKTILPAMRDYFETEQYIFVHGWIPCQTTNYGRRPTIYKYAKEWRLASPQEWEYARWYNGIEAAMQKVLEPNKTIVCGHWNCSFGHFAKDGTPEFGPGSNNTPYYGEGIIAIDACTASSHMVNCIKLIDNPLKEEN